MQKKLAELILRMKTFSIEEYYAAFADMEKGLFRVEQALLPRERHLHEIADLCKEIAAEAVSCPAWMKVHLLSFCMKCGKEIGYVKMLLREVLDADYDDLGEYSKYFLYWQISSGIFGDANLQSREIDEGRAMLYRRLYEAFFGALHMERFSRIPLEERDREKVFVFTPQFLEETHGPTKTVCDRAYFLQKYLGKKVTIINTAMLIPRKGDAPFYNRDEGGYIANYLGKTGFRFRDEIFHFFQCGDDMPDLAVIEQILRRVSEEKPYCILSIGGGDLCADLCGAIVPEIVISTVHSELAVTTGTFQVMENDLAEANERFLQILGVKKENVSKALFTYVFKEQKAHYKREDLGLPKDAKLLLVTGWRLSHEVQENFLQMLETIVTEVDAVEVVFMGLFEDYEKRVSAYANLKQNSHYLAYQEDALAVTELCDLYVNPRRKGGGTSVAEALFQGLPAVTLPFGDVAAAAGEAFWVKDYAEMEETIRKYCTETEFYTRMSELAKERAAELTDSRKHFCKVFEEIEKKPDFR